jgi:lipoyl(octanoyl) transferase
MLASHAALAAGEGPERLALLQHPPVYTIGAREAGAQGAVPHLLVPLDELAARGAALEEVDRGGDITFHGPGQLVAYPILDLRRRGLRAADYVRALEQTVIEALASLGVPAERVPGRPGVWTALGPAGGALEKIAAIGVRIRRGVSSHGLALNVSTDLEWFDAIVPCGIADAGVTSLERALGRAVAMAEAEAALAGAFARRFDAELVEPDAREARRGELAAGAARG